MGLLHELSGNYPNFRFEKLTINAFLKMDDEWTIVLYLLCSCFSNVIFVIIYNSWYSVINENKQAFFLLYTGLGLNIFIGVPARFKILSPFPYLPPSCLFSTWEKICGLLIGFLLVSSDLMLQPASV